MNALNTIKMLLPINILRYLKSQHRNYVFRCAMKRFMQNPESSIQQGKSIISDLIYGWGNEGWSAMEEYLECCIEHALTSNGPMLECGSGLSTVMLGAIAQRLDRYKINSVNLSSNPLKDYGGFSWYDPPLATMPKSFALVICDGPPGNTKGGRYGLVPIMKDRMKSGCIVLLDDASRDEEQAIARRWQTELGASSETLGQSKPYIKITL